MSPSPTTKQEFPRHPLSVRFGQAFRRYFVAGLATLFPVAVTIWLVIWIFRIADRMLGKSLGIQIPGLGLVVTLLVVLSVGVFSIHFFGRVVFQTIETAFARLPFIKKIYPAVKQLARFLFSEEGAQAAFRRVVLVQYPRPGAYSIAFVTNEAKTTATGKPQTLLTLLIPNPPSPFTGPIIFVPEEDVVPLDLSVEDAVKLIVSGGVVASPLQAAQRLKGTARV
ncbi:MAG: DUF502 domain-containing protein [Candidatus Omnitrophica bacterium]|nr:DUF502 domain-containing protein [Candidatus Omnitrophota bacterium]